MRMLPLFVLPIVAVVTIVLTQPWNTAEAAKPMDSANSSAVCVEPSESFKGKTIGQWRAEGPEGLAKLVEVMKPTIDAYIQSKATDILGRHQNPLPESDLADLLLLDQVAQQRDAYAAGLYWYTDRDEAVAEAQRTGKPILSLRMLGKLVDEYSCANSRFFRTVLYADASISKMLREQFVLHWQSVRPVPVITIDMGDGRTIKRTITGNSAHYILDPNGRVVDCLPGLYASGTFERLVQSSGEIARNLQTENDLAFAKTLAAVHKGQADQLDRAWARYMRALDSQDNPRSQQDERLKQIQAIQVLNGQNPSFMPDARQAGQIAFAGKGRVERPLVDAVLLDGAPTAQQASEDSKLWERVAVAYHSEAKMDHSSRTLMAAKAPQEKIEDAMRRAMSKAVVESPLARMVRNFEGGLAIETARNEHLLHRQLNDWFQQAKAPLDLAALNKRVYAELFLTPDEDPWLGLVPADTYSALDGGGLIEVSGQGAQR